jgi:TonB family protein
MPSAISKETCPSIWRFAYDEGTDRYALVLRSPTASKADVHVRLVSGTQAYSLDLPAIGIDMSTNARLVHYRSSPVLLHVPILLDRAGVVVRFYGALESCPPAVANIVSTKYAPPDDLPNVTPTYAELARTLASESKSSPVHELQPANGNDPTCDIPNRSVRPIKPVTPSYPDIARMQGASGQVLTILDIDGEGKVVDSDIFLSSETASLDQAARAAAMASTYAPASVGCTKSGGVYIYRVDFSSR